MVKLTWREKRRLRDQGLMPPAANARVVFTEQMDATLRLSVECGKSFSDYAAQLGISADTVGKRAKKLGILSSQSRGKNKPVDWSVVGPIVDRERGRGESERRIGRTVSLSGGTVRKYLIANGLSGRVGQLRKAGLIPPCVQEIKPAFVPSLYYPSNVEYAGSDLTYQACQAEAVHQTDRDHAAHCIDQSRSLIDGDH